MKPTSGPRGKIKNAQLWNELTAALNSEGSGEIRTTEKWKKVWSDLKNNTKRKAAKIHKEATRTEGGPACHITLSDLEERVLAIIDIRSAVGLPNPEIGFEAEMTQEVQPPEPQPSASQVESILFSQELVDSDEIFGPMAVGGVSVQTAAQVHAAPAPELSLASQTTPPAQTLRSAPPARSAEAVPGTSRTLFPPVNPRSPRRRGAVGSPPGQLRRRMRQQVSHMEAATNQFVRSDAEWREQMNERERRAEERERRMEEREARAEERQVRALQLEEGWQRLFERLVAVAEKIVEKFY